MPKVAYLYLELDAAIVGKRGFSAIFPILVFPKS